MRWLSLLHWEWSRLFYLVDTGLIVYISVQLVLLTILKLEWAENYWKPNGSGYSKGSTMPDRRRCKWRILICSLILIASTLLQCYLKQCYFHYHVV